MGYDDFEDGISKRFICPKCRRTGARVRSVAMTGTGLSRLFDLQHNRFVFASCGSCGFTEVYDKNVVGGNAMNVLDILFGG